VNEQDSPWIEVWRERVLPSSSRNPELALAGRPGVGVAPAADAVALVRQYYPEPQWLDVSLYDVGAGKQKFLVVAGAISVEPWSADQRTAYLTTGATFVEALAALKRSLAYSR